MPEFAEFPREEYEARYARVRQRMEREGLGALLATSEPNYRYLCGHHTQRWGNPSRPRALLLPSSGEPVLMMGAIEIGSAKATSWIQNIRSFAGAPVDFGYGAHLVDLIGEAVAAAGIRTGKIGIERGGQMRAGFSVDDFVRLERRLAPIVLVDASPIFWEVRAIKSPGELAYVRRAVEILNRAFRDVQQEVRVGMTESELYRLMSALLYRHGAERPTYNPVNFHAGGRMPVSDHIFFGDVTERKLANNNVIDMDGGCTYRGYWSDYNRVFAVGSPPEKARVAYHVLQEAVSAGIEATRPGRPIADVARAFAKVLAKLGAKESDLGRAGHGMGLNQPEPPSLSAADPTVLAPGMVLCLEPTVVLDGYGIAVAEEQVVVTETGCELLSERAPAELPILR